MLSNIVCGLDRMRDSLTPPILLLLGLRHVQLRHITSVTGDGVRDITETLEIQPILTQLIA